MRLVLDLVACQTPQSRDRGIGRYSLALAEAVLDAAADRHEIHLLLSAALPESVDELVRRFAPRIPPQRIVRYAVPAPLGALEPANAWRSEAAALLRESAIAALAPDVVHVSSLFEGLLDDASVSVGRLERIPTAVTLYDLIPLLDAETFLSREPVDRWYRARLEDLKRADLLLAISDHTRSDAIDALGIDPDRIVPVSADADPRFRRVEMRDEDRVRFLGGLGLHRPFVMYTGGVDPRKNLDGMIRAYGRVPADVRRGHQLAVVCRVTGDERRRLLDVGERAGLAAGELVLPGFVPDDDLVKLYSACRLFVFPSLYEGFGLPALEAMRCGAPVVGSNRSSVPEVIGLADALFDPADPGAVAAAVRRGLTDEAFRARLVANAAQQSTRFSWAESGRRALAALEALGDARARGGRAEPPRAAAAADRPRLGYVSPLPPESSGIADFSAELLPALAEHYDITLVTDGPPVSAPALRDRFPRVTVAEFAAAPERWDRVLYQMGNSVHHAHVPGLLETRPGVVVLHDVFLSHLMRHLGAQGRARPFLETLLENHGYPAAEFLARHGEDAAVWEYPCSRDVIGCATGLVVQSAHARDLVARWYGPAVAARVREIPHPRDPAPEGGRDAARAALGIPPAEFVVCCFGMIGPAKLNHELLRAFRASPLGRLPGCRLVFVGGDAGSPYGRDLRRLAGDAPGPAGVTITGYADEARYRRYLDAADVAVQLRTRSRGETSGAVLDGMAHGLPVIVNAHGASAELPDGVVWPIADPVREAELAEALGALHRDAARRAALGRAARAYLARERDTRRIARRYRDVVEAFHATDPFAGAARLVRAVRGLPGTAQASDAELAEVARCIADNDAAPRRRQLLVDISTLVRTDANSGIQRVVRSTLACLLRRPLEGWIVEPVYRDGTIYRHARRFCTRLAGMEAAGVADGPVDAGRDDVFLGLDLDPGTDGAGRAWIRRAKARGVATWFVLYDIIPLLHPHRFPADFATLFRDWIEQLAPLATGVVCISEAVADEYRAWLGDRANGLAIRSYPLGADLDAATPDGAPRDDERAVLGTLEGRPFLLMVGTVEPRKRHDQVLGALERLWSAGDRTALVIVGRQGWMVDSLAARMRAHPEAGRRLFWLEQAGDPMLRELYRRAAALVQASEAEGFGLPLVEAAQHGTPIVARDLPVFREVAGEHAFYFDAGTPEDLAERLREWLRRREHGAVPDSRGIRRLTWAESTEELLARVLPKEAPRAAPGCAAASPPAPASA